MSTPTSPVVTPPKPPIPAPTISTITKDWSWFCAHLIAILIVAGVAMGGVYLVEKLVANRDAAQAAQYSALAAQQTQQTKILQQQLTTDEANWATVQAQLLAQNSQLAQAISQKNQQLAVQVKTDATLDAQQAAARLAQQIQANPGDIRAQNDNVNLGIDSARRVVSDLDTLPVVTSNLASTQMQLTNETTIANNAQADATAQKQVVSSLESTITADGKACDARVTAAKAAGRKSGLKGFFIGAASVALAVLGHAL